MHTSTVRVKLIIVTLSLTKDSSSFVDIRSFSLRRKARDDFHSSSSASRRLRLRVVSSGLFSIKNPRHTKKIPSVAINIHICGLRSISIVDLLIRSTPRITTTPRRTLLFDLYTLHAPCQLNIASNNISDIISRYELII